MPADDDLSSLVHALRHPSGLLRAKAARGLAKAGPPARAAYAHLLAAVNDEEQAVREAAVQAIAGIGPEAVPTLVGFLTHSDKYIRRNAVWGIGKFGPAATPALNALCASLRDADPRTASGAAQAIGAMGTAGAAAVPALDAAMRGANVVLCRLAAKALSQIGPPALPTLLKALKDADPFVRGEAAIALGWMGPAAAPAVPALVQAVGGAKPAPRLKRAAAAVAVGSHTVTPPAPPAPPAAADNLPGGDAARLAAIQSLGRIGAAAKAAVPALEDVAANESEALRDAAETALRQIHGSGQYPGVA